MKTQDIKRGITSRHYRVGGSTPDIGGLSRLRNAEILSTRKRRRSRRGRSPAVDSRSSTIWLILLGGGALTLIVVTIFVWLMQRMEPEPVEMVSSGVEDEHVIRIASKFPSPSREESLEIARNALAARDPAEVTKLFRTGGATPAEIIRFLEMSTVRDGEIEHYEWLSSMDSDGFLIEGVGVLFKGKDRPVERLALLTPDESGVWKVDFGAFARLVEPGWQELLENRAEQATVRVTVAPDVYYNGPFSDDKQWVCYGMVSPDIGEILRGYCRAGSPQAEAMGRLFKHGEKLSRATIGIRRVKDGDAKQFEIINLLGDEWIVAGAPGRSS